MTTPKRSIALLVCIFCAFVCWGQQNQCAQIGGGQTMCTNYAVVGAATTSTIPDITFTDQVSYSTTHNVWHSLPATPAMARVAAGEAGTWALTSAGAIYQLTAAYTWSLKSGAASDICVGANVYVVGATQGSSNLYQWSGTAWALIGNKVLARCADGADDDLWGLDSSGNIFHMVSGSFTQVAGGAFDISVGNASTVYVLGATQSGKDIYYRSGSTWTQPLPGILTQISASASGDIYGLNGSTIKVYHNSAWATPLGGCSWITTAGSMGTKCIGATINNASVYEFPNKSMKFLGRLIGNTVCNPSGCPPSTHIPTVQVVFQAASLNGGQTVSGPPQIPEAQVNVTAQDVTWDPFYCLEGGFTGANSSNCLTKTGGPPDVSVGCSIVGPILAGDFFSSLNYNFCDIPKHFFNLWNNFQTIHVYFDVSAFPGMSGSAEAQDIFGGIQEWAGLTARDEQYAFGGLVTTGGSCGYQPTGWAQQVGLPCSPTYPFIVVTASPTGDPISHSTSVITVANGQRAVTTIASGVISGTQNRRITTGAHEEGHRQGLDDCGRVSGDCGSLTETGTVMWYQYKTDQPLAPSRCDILWANIHSAY